MIYRRLGRSGLKVSELSYGSWVTFGQQQQLESVTESMQAAWDAGCNFFDNAESYAAGRAERLMGQAFKDLEWSRESYIVSTKFYWGIVEGPNTTETLNRKYLLQAIDRSLERLQLEFVDLIYCHRPDPETPMEETVWAMHDIISAGKALYWGTSEWPADQVREAHAVANRLNLRKPVVEQPAYSFLERHRVEVEYRSLIDEVGIGLTTYSPLAFGVLTGKYLDGIPAGSRAEVSNLDLVQRRITDSKSASQVRALMPIAAETGCTMAQFALAWCLANQHVSSVITGASSASQVRENMLAVEIVDTLTPDVMAGVERALA